MPLNTQVLGGFKTGMDQQSRQGGKDGATKLWSLKNGYVLPSGDVAARPGLTHIANVANSAGLYGYSGQLHVFYGPDDGFVDPGNPLVNPHLIQYPLDDFTNTLTGLSWQLPCGTSQPPFSCACPHTTQSSVTLPGDATILWTLTFRIRGVIELNEYTGGEQLVPAYLYKGASGHLANVNIYKLVVTNPAAVYYVNNGTFDASDIGPVDYEFTIEVAGGGTVTLAADSGDSAEIRNVGNHSVTDDNPDQPIVVTQPYDGQFLQLDVSNIA